MPLDAPCYRPAVASLPVRELQVCLAASLVLGGLANVFARGCHLGKGLAHAIMALPASGLVVALAFVALRVATRPGRERLRREGYGLGVILIVLFALAAMTLPAWIIAGRCP